MDELISLVDQHKFWRNGFRVNLDKDENHRRVDKKRADVAKVSLRAAQQYGARGADPRVRADDAAKINAKTGSRDSNYGLNSGL